MSQIYTINDKLVESRLFLNRIVAAFMLILALTVGLVVRLVYLQIVGHEHYATLAKDNSIKIEPLVPTRGIIYDRHGKVLAENTQSFSLELIPEQIKDLDDTLRRLQQLLNISDEKIDLYQKQRKRQKRFVSTPLLISMTDEELAKFAVVRPYFPGVDIQARLVRHYPYAELASHVIGYVGRINEAEMKSLPLAEYRGSTYVGKIGIESTYEEELHGKTGYAEIETNVQARAINTVNSVPPIAGENIYLTLDIDLQKTAYDALSDYNGAVVAIEVKTGAVLVFVSRPGFDPNPFVIGIPNDAYQALQTSESQPLYNRALRGLYPPGSTVKPFVGLAGLETNTISVDHKLFCPGYYQLPNVSHHYRDWKKGGHGSVNMEEAITQSCDVYFYSLASMLGIDRIYSFLHYFGFGEKTGIDLVGEKQGLLPSREWKRARRNQAWYPGETLITGIGQGYLQVTPVQLAKAVASLANGGRIITPYLAKKPVIDPGMGKIHQDLRLPLKSENLNRIVSAMINVIHDPHGTAKGINKDLDFLIAGKTGTAQVFNIKQDARYNENDIDFKLRDHALFISFAPADDPKIAVAVIAENGGHGGSVAAPIAAQVIKQYLAGNHENRNPG